MASAAINSVHLTDTIAIASTLASGIAAISCHACSVPQPCREFTEKNSSTIKVHTDAEHFDCNICLDGCCDPVVTHCGHIFCWPCLNSWLSYHSFSKECPVCKANVKDKIIPVYGCGKPRHSINSAAVLFPDVDMPSRPSPHRSDVQVTYNHAIQEHEIHTRFGVPSFNVDFFASMGSYDMILLAFRSGVFLCEWVRSGAAILERQRWRLRNKHRFVLHWASICVASIAIVFFIVS